MASPPRPVLGAGAADAVPIQLRFFNVGELHQGYFSREPGITALGKRLAACTTHTAEVVVSYDVDTRTGKIVFVVPPDSTTCNARVDGSGAIDLRGLEPLGVALARYRDHVAGMSDFRVANFKTGLHFTRGLTACELVLAGQYPPDGTTWSPCVAFAGDPKCADGDPEDGVTAVKFASPADQAYLQSCLGL